MIRFCTLLLLLSATQLAAQNITWISACTPRTFCLDPGSCSQGHATMMEEAVTNCNNSPILSYSYKIDLFNNNSVDIQADVDTFDAEMPKGIH
ncbi:MAG: hypothetical protein ABIO24_04680, partial [Saprospiraceae bacterium]